MMMRRRLSGSIRAPVVGALKPISMLGLPCSNIPSPTLPRAKRGRGGRNTTPSPAKRGRVGRGCDPLPHLRHHLILELAQIVDRGAERRGKQPKVERRDTDILHGANVAGIIRG